MSVNAMRVTFKSTGKAIASTRMNAEMVIPMIVTRTPFARTRKEATLAHVRMAIKTLTLKSSLEPSVRKSMSVLTL